MEGADLRDRFADALRAQGEDDAMVAAHLRIAERIVAVAGGWRVLPRHVDAALRQAEADGATPQQLANLKQLGDTLVGFARVSGAPSAPRPDVSGSIPLSVPHGGRCPSCSGLLSITMPEAEATPLARVAGAAGAFGGFVAVRLFGCIGVLAVLSAGASLVALYRGFMTRPRCTQCGAVASRADLGSALQDELDVARRKAFLGAGGFGLAAVALFVIWIWAAIELGMSA